MYILYIYIYIYVCNTLGYMGYVYMWVFILIINLILSIDYLLDIIHGNIHSV